MRSAVFAIGLFILMVFGVIWSYQYWMQSNNLPQDLESRQEYNIALADVSSRTWAEPVVCLVGLPLVAWLFALIKMFPGSSIVRNLFAAMLVMLVVFWGCLTLMDTEIKQRNASYILSPGVFGSCLGWAFAGTLFALAIWFAIERLYVSFRIARDV